MKTPHINLTDKMSKESTSLTTTDSVCDVPPEVRIYRAVSPLTEVLENVDMRMVAGPCQIMTRSASFRKDPRPTHSAKKRKGESVTRISVTEASVETRRTAASQEMAELKQIGELHRLIQHEAKARRKRV